jgi:hypothetical protein
MTRSLAWLIYGVAFSALAVYLSSSIHAANALTWVSFAGVAAIVATVLARRKRPG